MPTPPPPHSATRRLVCLGQIGCAHGVRGLVKVRSFTDAPDGLTAYGPLTDAAGTRTFALTLLSQNKGQWLAEIAGVTGRDAAEALAGTLLYISRDRLPPLEADEFYHADLIGLLAESPEGVVVGRVSAVHDFGAGDVLEVIVEDGDRGSETLYLPFTRAVVPQIDLASGRLVVIPPMETETGAEAEKAIGVKAGAKAEARA